MPRSFTENPERYFSPGYRLLHSREAPCGEPASIFDDPVIRKCIDGLDAQEIARTFPRS
jgi:hypothetical protein